MELEEIERVAKLLETSGLEEDTSRLINETLREMIRKYRSGLNAPRRAEQHGLNPSVFAEWLNGPQSAIAGGDG